ncbi:MAG: hypothetical protein QXP45_00975 [Thermoproteota archaeon]
MTQLIHKSGLKIRSNHGEKRALACFMPDKPHSQHPGRRKIFMTIFNTTLGRSISIISEVYRMETRSQASEKKRFHR